MNASNSTNATNSTSAPTPEGNIISDIEKQLDFKLNIGNFGIAIGFVIGGLLCLVGVIFVFFGSRLFKYTIFLFTFALGAGLGYYVTTLATKDTRAGLIVAVVMGLILGCLAVKLWKFSLFIMGAGVGFMLWMTFKAFFPNVLDTPYLLYGSLAGVCIILGLIGMKLEKVWLMIGTPIAGSFMLVQGVDAFIPYDLNLFQMLTTQTLGCADVSCYCMYGGVILLAVVGFFVQYRWTSEYASDKAEDRADAREEREDKKERAARRKRRAAKRRKKKRRRSSSGSYSSSD